MDLVVDAALERARTSEPPDDDLFGWLMGLVDVVAVQVAHGSVLGRSVEPALSPDAYVELLHREFAEDVYDYVYRMCRNTHRSDDVTQETFERALLDARAGGEMRALPLPWLKRIARNALVDAYRRPYHRFELPAESVTLLDEVVPFDDSGFDLVESMVRLRDALETLSEDQRRAVTMRTLGGVPTQVVAVDMGRSEQAVRSLVHKAHRRLGEHYRGCSDDA